MSKGRQIPERLPILCACRVTIKAYDFASGKLTAKIADYKQESPLITHTSSKEPKDFNFGLLVPDVCKKISAWLARASTEKTKAK